MDLETELCCYCGQLADSVDHVVPQHLLKRSDTIDLSRFNRLKYWTVPSCSECNSAIGGKVFDTLAERRKYAQQHIRKKYAHVLKIPHWSDEEIEELGLIARRDLEAALKLQRIVRARLAWKGSPKYDTTVDLVVGDKSSS